MTKEQIENLGLKQLVYCKRHPGRPITYWSITHIFPDCVWVTAQIMNCTTKAYCARRVVHMKRLEMDWEVWR